ncbi:MAG: NAD-dependent epimerase/dehydratase family protein [Candidatus Dadabacteria bacterium]|nr:NAD-dependent epimerase/dehydratase family protein [Candidatus Dadabacteria bacterium]NIS07232.1 NAD-dependent epimerase/dehydratase family protein [Candidatus Dadabacteria bacterium]NIV40939.1 NAD-dependent epimerase/dehydratase family protein [Candidatus Dadabacteria bacterium]NIX14371.1 NAD-dependent epimerase/dehydratase family protein [Candidatus Dadabacteria bacterium]NIY20889.1 NAD-dependent epimerase/dehydratase family protein [Candidatus Dadabacteria bacterium]
MKVIVTGAAGFIGSTLSEKLISEGSSVIGIDSVNDNYDVKIKKNNLQGLLANKNFEFINSNILEIDFSNDYSDIEAIFHQAATAGVRTSWGKNFRDYTENNIMATQYLLESFKNNNLKKFIYASSSSVYGNSDKMPLKISTLTRPVSPYGVTKLAAENLVNTYHANYGLPAVSLRYFTVYGPRQRPDMAFHIFMKSAIRDIQIKIYGDGEQIRDFTYVDDVVSANMLALENGISGSIYNVGGGSHISVNEVLKLIEEIAGRNLNIDYQQTQKGDVRRTEADISLSRKELGYESGYDIKSGLENEFEWIRNNIDLLT